MNLTAKNDYIALVYDMVQPLKDYFTQSGLKIGHTGAVYNERTSCAEGFLRILWGLVPCVAGGSTCFDEFVLKYNEGFRLGTDKNSDAYWGDTSDVNQMFVEMTTIAYAIFFADDKFWAPLDEAAKDNLAKWLYSINEHVVPTNNWQMFRVLINCALKKVNRKYSQKNIDESIETVMGTYLGDGWYTDGYTKRRDYYVSFAIHFYCLIYSKVMENDDKERCELFKSRAEKFAKEFIYWFSENGDAVPYGRSLTYRFAQVSFWSACLLAGVKPFDYGVIKGIIVRHFNSWLSSPVFDNRGILTLGYKYPDLFMTECYNAPGSPYWAFKAFAFLMLDDNHPFWKAPVKPLPDLDEIKTLGKAEMVISRDKDNICLYSTGLYENTDMGKMDCKYSKFVYSTKFGFSVSRDYRSLKECSPDSMLAFVINDFVYVRNCIDEGRTEDNRVYSKWSPVKGIEVQTEIIPQKNGHIRRHIIQSEFECEAYDCGFAVRNDEDTHMKSAAEGEMAYVKNIDSMCTVNGKSGEGYIIEGYPNTNLIYSRTFIPSVRYKINKGETRIETFVKYM